MEYSIISPKVEVIFREIRKKIRNLQNWGYDVARKNMNLPTGGYNGATFISLKKLASDYAPDDTLALLLWNTGQREEQITACFLFTPLLNKEKITQLTLLAHSYEVAEYIGSVYIVQRNDLEEVISYWQEENHPYLLAASLTAAARHRIIYKTLSPISDILFNKLIYKEYTDHYVSLIASRYK